MWKLFRNDFKFRKMAVQNDWLKIIAKLYPGH